MEGSEGLNSGQIETKITPVETATRLPDSLKSQTAIKADSAQEEPSLNTLREMIASQMQPETKGQPASEPLSSTVQPNEQNIKKLTPQEEQQILSNIGASLGIAAPSAESTNTGEKKKKISLPQLLLVIGSTIWGFLQLASRDSRAR